MRPKRASSWNISRSGRRWSKPATTSTSVPGSFFPVLAGLRVAVGVSRVGSELAPAVAGKHAVHAGQGQRLTQPGLDLGLELGHHQHRAVGGTAQHLVEDLGLALKCGTGPVAQLAFTARRSAPAFGYGHKARAHVAGRTHRAADRHRGLLQAQAQLQRQQHRLGLAHLFNRLGRAQQFARRLKMLRPARCPGHDKLLKSAWQDYYHF